MLLVIFAVATNLGVPSYALMTSSKAPEIKSVKCLDGKMKITWKKAENAVGYKLYKKNGSGKWALLAEMKENRLSYEDSAVKDGVTNSYRLRAVYKKSESAYCNFSRIYMSVPKLKSVTNTASGVKITWGKCNNATQIRVYRQLEGRTNWNCIAKLSGSAVSYTDTKAESAKTYTYKVRQINGEVFSASQKSGVSLTVIGTPKSVSVKNSPDGVTLKWSKIPSVYGYAVWRKTENGSWKRIASVVGDSKTSYIDKKTAYGKKNSYKVRAYLSAKKYGCFSESVSLYSVNPKKPMVALTYDDGPSSSATSSILDTLEAYGARATFFVVGSRVASYASQLKREAKLGCEIGNHTFNHTTLTSASSNTIRKEIEDTNRAIQKYSGKTPALVRAPGGAVNQNVKSVVKYPLINWSVDTLDWKSRNADSVIAEVKRSTRDGSVVLMHDLYNSTAQATKTIVPYLIDEGYQLVTVSEMMDAKGIRLESGTLYTRAS